jgi:hypothetical protein
VAIDAVGEQPGGKVTLGVPLHPVDVSCADRGVAVDRDVVSETGEQRPLRAGRDEVPVENIGAGYSASDTDRLRTVEGTLEPSSQPV